MVIKARGELIDVNDQVNLTVQFKDGNGNPVDTDSFPQISITQPNGLIIFAATSVGVTRISTGKYSFIFTVPFNGPYGVFADTWIANISGVRIESTFNFIVSYTDMQEAPNTDGYVHLGDDPGFDYSQNATKNINKLIKILKARLNSSGLSKSSDSYGNVQYITCDIFSIDVLTTFLANGLMEFNQVPYFTFFTFEDNWFVDQFGEVLVEYATLYALASKALIERGREWTISDQGISFTPPTVSDIMTTQYSALLSQYWERIKLIKNSLRPHPKGLGIWSATNSSINPAIRRLRFLRERRLF